ncbi:MAG: hypothetical protein RLZZ282_111, partial [Verrucomicrobiota bacterium]
MMNPLASEFLFALTNPGSEMALKLEAAPLELPWRPSYQRRGFVTFKSDKPMVFEALDVPLACARRLCLSLGKCATYDLARQRIVAALATQAAPVVHHARFQDRRMQGVHDAVATAPVRVGQVIGTVVELGPDEYWAGLHRHARFLSPEPAGDAAIVMPSRSPSRAWLKLEEAIRFFGLRFSPEDIVVELGCAPGGVALALLDRGVPVIGVDPAGLADVVLEYAVAQRQDAPANRPWFFHCRKPAALVSKRDLGQGVTWFMSDMNQAPEVVLKECGRFCRMAPTISAALITLKLTDLAQVAGKASWLESLTAMGFRTIRLQQLSVHH